MWLMGCILFLCFDIKFYAAVVSCCMCSPEMIQGLLNAVMPVHSYVTDVWTCIESFPCFSPSGSALRKEILTYTGKL